LTVWAFHTFLLDSASLFYISHLNRPVPIFDWGRSLCVGRVKGRSLIFDWGDRLVLRNGIAINTTLSDLAELDDLACN